MYPITFYPLWETIIAVIVLGALGYWVADKDNSARPLGLMALPIAMVTGWTWFTSQPAWTAVVVASVTTLLFLVGMTRDENKDDHWHYGAVAVALFGKLVTWFLPWLWLVLSGQVNVPVWILALLILITLFSIATWRSERARSWGNQLGQRVRKEPTTNTT